MCTVFADLTACFGLYCVEVVRREVDTYAEMKAPMLGTCNSFLKGGGGMSRVQSCTPVLNHWTLLLLPGVQFGGQISNDFRR